MVEAITGLVLSVFFNTPFSSLLAGLPGYLKAEASSFAGSEGCWKTISGYSRHEVQTLSCKVTGILFLLLTENCNQRLLY